MEGEIGHETSRSELELGRPVELPKKKEEIWLLLFIPIFGLVGQFLRPAARPSLCALSDILSHFRFDVKFWSLLCYSLFGFPFSPVVFLVGTLISALKITLSPNEDKLFAFVRPRS